MTNDEVLIKRLRPILSRREEFSEEEMFGGICFMINGNMCVGTWKGSLIVRLDREHHESLAELLMGDQSEERRSMQKMA